MVAPPKLATSTNTRTRVVVVIVVIVVVSVVVVVGSRHAGLSSAYACINNNFLAACRATRQSEQIEIRRRAYHFEHFKVDATTNTKSLLTQKATKQFFLLPKFALMALVSRDEDNKCVFETKILLSKSTKKQKAYCNFCIWQR